MRARGLGFVFQSKYKDGGIVKTATTWSIRYRAGKRQITESSGSDNRRDAEKLLKLRLEEIKTKPPIGRKLKFEDLEKTLVNDYTANSRKSLKRIKEALAHLAGYFADYDVEDIDRAAIIAYRASRQAGPGTINREVAALKAAMKLADVQVPRIKMLKEPEARSGFFSRSEVEQLASELPLYFKGVLRFAYITGWRAREITTRRWDHVDFINGWVRLEPGETKNGGGREFPITPELREVLEAQRERCDAIEVKSKVPVRYVFPYDDGRGPIGQYDSIWRRACRLAGLEGKLLHDCRRSAVRNLERAGV